MNDTLIKVKIKNESSNPLPAYGTKGSAAQDVQAYIPSKGNGEQRSIIIEPGERALVPTGLFLEIPEGFELQVRPRSGLALKHGITVLNSPGTIDSDYRGELGIILVNTSKEQYKVLHSERIAQISLYPTYTIDWEETTELEETERGEGGFGSTGK